MHLEIVPDFEFVPFQSDFSFYFRVGVIDNGQKHVLKQLKMKASMVRNKASKMTRYENINQSFKSSKLANFCSLSFYKIQSTIS